MNKFMHGLPKEIIQKHNPKDLYKGMRIRPSMDMIVNYIEKDPYKIKYPDRDATFYLNSPQFLNILTDSGLGMGEQSIKLAERHLAEARARAEGRGGAVNMATDRDDDAVSTTGDAENAERLRIADMQEQERVRLENEAQIARQRQAEQRAREEQARSAVSSAAAAASSSSEHSLAATKAKERYVKDLVGRLTDVNESPDVKDAILLSLPLETRNEVIQMMGNSPEEYDEYLRAKGRASAPLLTGTRDVVYTPTPDAPFASQLAVASAASAAAPAVLNVPRPAGEVGMSSGSQVKRGGDGDGTSPKAKAKSGASPSSGPETEAATTKSRKRGVSVPPRIKHEETERKARELSLDQALRSDEAYLKTVNPEVLRTLITISTGKKTFINSKGKEVYFSSAGKTELIQQIIRHFQREDQTMTRLEQLGQASGGSSAGAVVVKKAPKFTPDIPR